MHLPGSICTLVVLVFAYSFAFCDGKGTELTAQGRFVPHGGDFDNSPLQLVARTPGGGLEVVESTLAYLEAAITEPVEVISVLGGFHQGKSFLLNKLASLDVTNAGFDVTNSVRPTTKGISVWGAPLSTTMEEGTRCVCVESGFFFQPLSDSAFHQSHLR